MAMADKVNPSAPAIKAVMAVGSRCPGTAALVRVQADASTPRDINQPGGDFSLDGSLDIRSSVVASVFMVAATSTSRAVGVRHQPETAVPFAQKLDVGRPSSPVPCAIATSAVPCSPRSDDVQGMKPGAGY